LFPYQPRFSRTLPGIAGTARTWARHVAVKWRGAGSSVQRLAGNPGYESASSFVSLFRKAMGVSPGRYMAERRLRGD